MVNPPRPVTITDVARLAGVSKGAVSFALNNRPGVSDATRKRIIDVAIQLGWTPDPTARALSGARTNTLGLVIVRTPQMQGVVQLFQDYLEGVQSATSESQMSLLMQVAANHQQELAILQSWARGRRVDGVAIIDSRLDDDRPGFLIENGLACVEPGMTHHDPAGAQPAVDYIHGTSLALDHLLEGGHRRVAHIGMNLRSRHAQERGAAFMALSQKHGLNAASLMMPETVEEAARFVDELLQDPSRPTALICDDERHTVHIMTRARRLGIEVPDDLALVVWDTSEYAEILGLTSIDHQPLEQARAAVADLQTIHAGEVPEQRQFRPTLEVRQSTSRRT